MRMRIAIASALAGLVCGSIAWAEAPRFVIRWVRPIDVDRFITPVHPIQNAMPVVSGPWVVAGTRNGLVRAMVRTSGKEAWSLQTDGPIEASLSRDANHVYAGTVSGTVYAISPTNGSVKWTYAAGHEILGRPQSANGLVLFTTGNNQLFAVKASDGSWVWQYSGGEDPTLSIRAAAGVTVVGNDVYTGFSNGTFVRLNASTGKAVWSQVWKEQSRFDDLDATPVVFGSTVCTIVYSNRLICLKTADGATAWTANVAGHQAPEVRDGVMYLGLLDGTLRAFDAETGAPKWTQKLSNEAVNSPRLNGDLIYATDNEGGVSILKQSDGTRLWHYTGSNSGISVPALVTEDGSAYVITNLGHLFRFDSRLRSR